MTLDEKIIYDENVDKVFGYVTTENTFNEENDGKQGKKPPLANHILAFVIIEIFSNHFFPVGYFLTRSIKKDAFYSFTNQVLELLYGYGYRVFRLVADNHKVNVACFVIL